jgi:shikimate kinase
MGVGKTTIGKKLANRLSMRFTDMDEFIEKQEGMSVQTIFSLKGEPWFRSKESEVLLKLALEKEDLVISTGGGAPCFNNNMEFINSSGVSIYLHMSVPSLVKRLSQIDKKSRPLIAGKSEKELFNYVEAKLSEREYFYLQSKHIVSVENFKIEDILEALNS